MVNCRNLRDCATIVFDMFTCLDTNRQHWGKVRIDNHCRMLIRESQTNAGEWYNQTAGSRCDRGGPEDDL